MKLEDRIVENPTLWGLAAPRAMASNNWVVSGSKTASGFAMLAVLEMWDADSVKDGMACYGKIETGWSYVFADTNGDIGFQMSGKVPKRPEGISGLVPLPAWKEENHWHGYLAVDEMPRAFNPPQGYFCTANNDLNHWGIASPTNMPMGAYLFEQIYHALYREVFGAGGMGEQAVAFLLDGKYKQVSSDSI